MGKRNTLWVAATHITDIAGIAALTMLALNGDVSNAVIAAITSIALLKRGGTHRRSLLNSHNYFHNI